jgi:hypothetical protein
MILKPEQAAAVYAAMVALNNVWGTISCKIPAGVTPGDTRRIFVEELESNGRIRVSFDASSRGELHDNQNSFAKAYGLE